MAQQEPTVSREALGRLAQSREAEQLLGMLGQREQVQAAAQAAAKGNTTQLMEMLGRLMGSPEGAKLVEQLQKKVSQ